MTLRHADNLARLARLDICCGVASTGCPARRGRCSWVLAFVQSGREVVADPGRREPHERVRSVRRRLRCAVIARSQRFLRSVGSECGHLRRCDARRSQSSRDEIGCALSIAGRCATDPLADRPHTRRRGLALELERSPADRHLRFGDPCWLVWIRMAGFAGCESRACPPKHPMAKLATL